MTAFVLFVVVFWLNGSVHFTGEGGRFETESQCLAAKAEAERSADRLADLFCLDLKTYQKGAFQ